MKKIITGFLILLSVLITKESASAFTDVKDGQYYTDAVDWAVEKGIVSGYKDGTFKPNEVVTIGQFIKMFYNTFGFEQVVPNDPNEEWFDYYYNNLDSYGIKMGSRDGNSPIYRGQVAILLAAANGKYYNINDDIGTSGLPKSAEQAIKFVLENGISTGQYSSGNYVENFGHHNELTRAQAVTFLYRLNQKGLDKINENILLNVFPKEATFDTSTGLEFSNGVKYHEINTSSGCEVVFTYNNKILGIYDSTNGKTVAGVTIGVDTEETVIKKGIFTNGRNDYKSYGTTTIFVDDHDNNIVNGILYISKASTIDGLLESALSNGAENKNTLAEINKNLTNSFRQKFDLQPLDLHNDLVEVAYLHSKDMHDNDYFSHTNLSGLGPNERLKSYFGGSVNIGFGENIALNYKNIFYAHHGWINSLGHRKNMLNPNHQLIGFGMYKGEKTLFTTVFLRQY